MNHFICYFCDKQLGGDRYIIRDESPFCITCFDSMFAEYCDYCGELIGVDQGQMSHGGQHWHANEICFSCSKCHISLLGKPFLPRKGVIYCSIACSVNDTSTRIDSEPVREESKGDFDSIDELQTYLISSLKFNGNQKSKCFPQDAIGEADIKGLQIKI